MKKINYARIAAAAWRKNEAEARKDPVRIIHRMFSQRLARHLRPKLKPGYRLRAEKDDPYRVRISSAKFHRQYLLSFSWCNHETKLPDGRRLPAGLVIHVERRAFGPDIDLIVIDVNDPKCFEFANQAVVRALTGLCVTRPSSRRRPRPHP